MSVVCTENFNHTDKRGVTSVCMDFSVAEAKILKKQLEEFIAQNA